MNNLKMYLNNFVVNFVRILSSNYFFAIVVVLFLLQSLWVALFFSYFIVFDEAFHFNAIKAFAEYKTPFIFNQSEEYDVFGNLAFGSASIFHYILSHFYLLGSFLGFSENNQVTMLRVLNVLMVTVGLVGFKALFSKINIRKWVANLALLFFATLPLFGVVSATINYDNMVFMITPYMFLALVTVFPEKEPQRIRFESLIIFILLGIFASLTKFTMLPFFLFAVLVVVIRIFKILDYKNFFNQFIYWLKDNKRVAIGTFVIFLVLGSMFFIRYGVSIMKYHTPIPDCSQVMSEARCDKSVVRGVMKELVSSRGERAVMDVSEYTVQWMHLMMFTSFYTVTIYDVYHPPSQAAYMYKTFVLFLLVTAFVAFLYFWKNSNLNDKRIWVLVVVPSLGYFATLFLFNVLNYYDYHSNVNVQPRYIFMIMPIFITLSFEMIARNYSGKHTAIKLTVLAFAVICMSQGSGIITQILKSSQDWYKSDRGVQNIWRDAKQTLSPFVDEE